MVQHQRSQSGAVLLGYRCLAALYAALVVVQAFLGSRGVFNAAEQGNLITWHERLANGMFVVILIQAVLAWVLFKRKAIGMPLAVTSTVLVPLTSVQIHLGHTAEGQAFANTISLHIPLGVLLMGLACVVTTMAWRTRGYSGASTQLATV